MGNGDAVVTSLHTHGGVNDDNGGTWYTGRGGGGFTVEGEMQEAMEGRGGR